MEELKLKGPFKFQDQNIVFDNIEEGTQGVYLWCVKSSQNLYRVYYVGEAINIKKRLRDHLKAQLAGKYTVHDPQKLKENILVLTHRANEGMVPRLSHLSPKETNQEFIDNIYLFIGELKEEATSEDNKVKCCRYEHGIVTHIQNEGQNILWVGTTRKWKGAEDYIQISTENSEIQYLTESTVKI